MSDDWRRCADVFGIARAHYAATRHGVRETQNALVGRLATGTMRARARIILLEGELGNSSLGASATEEEVPAKFWAAIREHTKMFPSPSASYRGDWEAGDFELCSLTTKQGDPGHFGGHVQNVRFHMAEIPFLEAAQNPATESGKSRGGRPTASWWGAFAEELAVYVHDQGVPSGSGTVGQSEIIEEICKRMAARGLEEPSRTSVQPVVNNVLRRVRSAG